MSKTKEQAFDINLFKRLLLYIKPYKKVFVGVLIAVILIAVSGAVRPKILQLAIDNNIATKTVEGFLPYVVIMSIMLFLEVIFQLLFIFYSGWLGQNVVKDVRVKLFNHLLRFKMQYYDNSSVGVLITRAVTDMERIADIFGQGLFTIFRDLLTMIVVSVFMLFMNWKLSFIVFIMLPVVLYATRIFQKYMKKAFEEVRTEVSNLNSFVQERITGMKILQLFTREDTEYEKFKEINERHKKGWLKTVWYNSIFFPIAELATSITIGLVAWYGGLNVVLSETASEGDLVSFIMFIPMLFRPLRQIADNFNTLQMGMVASERVLKLLESDHEREANGTKVLRPLKGAIEFESVDFHYNEGEPILHEVSFKVAPGETVAVVGATGAGKSTIISILMGFYPYSKGRVSIDGEALKELDLHDLRQQLALVLQDVFLFSDTVRSNIVLGDETISDEAILKAAEAIGIFEFIQGLPDGLDYNVQERGGVLSAGQRQLLAFLRAYITNPAVLILDEATSSIDSHTEEMIQRALIALTQNRTSVIIAHRLSTTPIELLSLTRDAL